MKVNHNNPRKSPNRLKLFTFLLLALLVISVLYQAYEKYYKLPQALPAREDCSLNDKACKVRLPDGRELSFGISPKLIPTNKPITLEVKLKQFQNVSSVVVFIASLDDMRDLNEIALNKQKDDRYTAQTTLDHSRSPDEGWLAIVHVYTPEDNITVPYRFSSNGKNH